MSIASSDGSHEAVYHRYRALVEGRHAGPTATLQRVIRGDPHHESYVEKYLQVLGTKAFTEADLQRATELRPAWRAAERNRTLFEDAYQAALWMHLAPVSGFYLDKDEYLYRGQRKEIWENTASLFRPDGPGLKHRRQRLLSLAGTLAHEHGFDARHAFATCQHYADAAVLDGPDPGFGAVSTWLLDVTWNPFIALAFATHGGVTGDTGLVVVLSRTEWGDRLGTVAPLDLADLSALQRPRQQQAAFITSRYPELVEDNIPVRLRFRQHTGLEFEDESLGASRANIYPADDPMTAAVRDWAEDERRLGHPPEPPVDLALPAQADRPAQPRPAWVDPGIYLRVCLADCHGASAGDRAALRERLKPLAVFHSWARALRADLEPRWGTWHPGLGGLLRGALGVRHPTGRPVKLIDLASEYYIPDEDSERQLTAWIESRWRMGAVERNALWHGTADPTKFLAAIR